MSSTQSTPKVSTRVEFFAASKEAMEQIRFDIALHGEYQLKGYVKRALHHKALGEYYRLHKKEIQAAGMMAADFKKACGTDKSLWSQDTELAKLHTDAKLSRFIEAGYRGENKMDRKGYIAYLKDEPAKEPVDKTGLFECRVEGGKMKTFVIADLPKSQQNLIAKMMGA